MPNYDESIIKFNFIKCLKIWSFCLGNNRQNIIEFGSYVDVCEATPQGITPRVWVTLSDSQVTTEQRIHIDLLSALNCYTVIKKMEVCIRP